MRFERAVATATGCGYNWGFFCSAPPDGVVVVPRALPSRKVSSQRLLDIWPPEEKSARKRHPHPDALPPTGHPLFRAGALALLGPRPLGPRPPGP